MLPARMLATTMHRLLKQSRLIVQRTVFVAAFVSLSSCTSSSPPETKAEPPEVSNKNYKDYPALAQAVSKFNANTEWKESCCSGAYSVDVEKALMGDKRPILFVATLDDVARLDDGYRLRFGSPSFSVIVFALKCNSEQAELGRSSNRGDRHENEYAVIASISSVKRVDDITTENDEHIEFGHHFVVDGQCLEMLSTRNLSPTK